MQGIARLAEGLLAPQEGLCPVELAHFCFHFLITRMFTVADRHKITSASL